ncbi:MAG: DNA-protecting protein DprA [Gemmatimonadaceae bacterium]|nr:DNA-protecting protein DprA [Gemmatimonadaceae bacterium]
MHNHSPNEQGAPDSTRDFLALGQIPGLGDVGIARAWSERPSARGIVTSRGADVALAAYSAADRVLASTATMGAYAVSTNDARYPDRLRELADPPHVIFCQGHLAMADAPAVAIVGTRHASSYGLRVARAIATTCARHGVTVISGLAQGIDGAAHEAALDAGGRTVGVLGTGLSVVYPRRHRALQERIGKEGLLVTELAPHQSGHGGTFPRRNRLIAALADVTVVVEAGEGSGALITANVANTLHRTVACVPNAIDVPSAIGSNALFKAGAEPILAPDDVLALLHLRAEPSAAPLLDGEAATVWAAISDGAADFGTIAECSGFTTRQVAAAITALELEGLVYLEPTGRIRNALTSRTRQ